MLHSITRTKTSASTTGRRRACGLLLLAACSSSRPADDVSRAPGRADSAIYAILLDTLRPGPRPAYVGRNFLALADTGVERQNVADWVAKELPGVERSLVLALDSVAPGDVQSAVGEIPGVTWVDSIHALEVERGLTTRRLILVSRIAFSSDSTRGVVHASMICGPLCGQGSYYLFHRDARGVWRMVGSATRSTS